MLKLMQLGVMVAVGWHNGVHHWTPNPLLAALLGAGAAYLLTGAYVRARYGAAGTPRPFHLNLSRAAAARGAVAAAGASGPARAP